MLPNHRASELRDRFKANTQYNNALQPYSLENPNKIAANKRFLSRSSDSRASNSAGGINAIGSTNAVSLSNLEFNRHQTGSLTTSDGIDPARPGRYVDEYQLSRFQVGQRVQINLDSSAFDTVLSVVDGKTGKELFYDDDSGPGLNSQLNFTTVGDVDYRIRVTSFGEGETGDYTLKTSNDNRAQVLRLDREHNGVLDRTDGFNSLLSTNYSKDYKLRNIKAGQAIQIDLSSRAFDPYLQLLDAKTGELITSNDNIGAGKDAQINFVAENNPYVVRVTSSNTAGRGQFNLSATQSRRRLSVNTLRLDRPVSGELKSTDGINPRRAGSFADDYRLSGTRTNREYEINLSSSAFNTYLQLIDARSGRVIQSNDDIGEGDYNSKIKFKTQFGKSYLVRVTSSAAGALGNYTLSANLAGQAIANDNITTNQSRSGSLSNTDGMNALRAGAYADDFRLTGVTANQRVQINLDSADFDPYLQLINVRTGQQIAFDDDSGGNSNAQLTFTAQSGVDYQIRVTSYQGYETGQYMLTTRTLAQSTSPAPVPAPVPPTVSPRPSPRRSFNSTTGYGMVNAAEAVARAIGQPTFSEVADLGGNDWGRDLVKAPEAWARGYTGQGVTIAVIDTGVDISHPELRNSIWRNTDEIPGNGRDDDGNGYVDDVNGWNFAYGQYNNNVTPGNSSWSQHHGTHVAGTIVAARDSRGVTGVAYGAKIMPLRLGTVDNNGRFTNGGDLAEAIRYAVDNGADIINMSIDWADSSSVREAVAYAASRNVVMVSSAGNLSNSTPLSPASYATNYGISVGAIDRNGYTAYFSNGAGADSRMHHVMAPGSDVYSSIPGGGYSSMSGTSMAAPHVTGVIALMLSANPHLTHAQVRDIITNTTTIVS